MPSSKLLGGAGGVNLSQMIVTNDGAAWLGTAIDPALGGTLRIFLVLLFARALVPKLRSPSEFVQAMRGYELLPASLVLPAAAGLLFGELLVIVGLMIPALASAAALGAALLLASYGLAIGVNLARGRRDIDCGCAGPQRRQTLHEALLIRNLIYLGLALFASVPLGTRVMGWLDGFTLVFASLTLFALAVALDELAAVAPRARALVLRS